MPRIVVIDGASSAGKTSLLRAFGEIAEESHRAYSIDGFLGSLAPGVFAAQAGSAAGWIEICRGFHRHLVAARTSEARMIVEVMLPWSEAREDLFARLGRDEIYYVQLFCSLHELERREKQRGDRRHGLARTQFQSVYAFADYDLRIDSTALTPKECAQLLLPET